MKFNHDTDTSSTHILRKYDTMRFGSGFVQWQPYLLIHIFHKFIRRRVVHKSNVSFCMDCKNNRRQISTTFNNTHISYICILRIIFEHFGRWMMVTVVAMAVVVVVTAMAPNNTFFVHIVHKFAKYFISCDGTFLSLFLLAEF